MDSKALKSLLKTLRDNGVSHYSTPELSLTLVPEALLTKKPSSIQAEQNEVVSDNPFASFPDGMLTPEQLMFYSAGGDPSEDPENN